jgi:diaminopimelate decarboxylase
MKMQDEVLRTSRENYGTPQYVFDLDTFYERYDYFKRIFGEEIAINYCMKTNPFLTDAALLKTDRIEVCSYGEFLICANLGIKPERLLISGVLKKREDMRVIMDYGRDQAIYTAESPSQLAIIREIATELGITVRVYMRLNCAQFGMDEDTIIELLNSENGEMEHIEFYGIHYFTGTQKHKLSKHTKEIQKLDHFFERIFEETGREVKNLEYGTGFGVPYFEGQEETVTAEAELVEFKKLLQEMEWSGNISLEMGRALAYNCGCYLTEIRDLKCSDGKNYAIVDGGIHQLHYDGQLRGMYVPKMHVIHRADVDLTGEKKTYSIHGSLCTTNDVLVGNYESEELHKGDIVVFENVGAYSVYEGMSLFLSHELPAIVLYSEQSGLKLVRSMQETYHFNTPLR